MLVSPAIPLPPHTPNEIEPYPFIAPEPDIMPISPCTTDTQTNQSLQAQKVPNMLKRLFTFNSHGKSEQIIASVEGGRRKRRAMNM